VSDEKLSAQEHLALIALVVAAREVTNAELREIAGIELSGPPRRRLNELRLVETRKVGRSFRHLLTDRGARRCQDELAATRPPRSGSYGGVLFAVLDGLRRYGEQSGPRLGEIFTPDVERMVRSAYRALAGGQAAAPVRLSALRERLTDVEDKLVDAELTRMADLPGVHLRAETNQQQLTEADRAAALRLGGEDRHNLQIEVPQSEAP
jgi:urease accessory protein UreF